jgi:hypothetical protein
MEPNVTNSNSSAYSTASTGARRTIASFDRYEDAQNLVDRLADRGFPVERVAIVGSDIKLVEQVTGKLDAARATLLGLGSGAVLGLLLGLLFGAIFAHDGTSYVAIFFYWLGIGALLGAIWGLISYAFSGKRSYTSDTGLRAGRYDVVSDEAVAAEALRLMGAGAGPASTSPTSPTSPTS